MLISKIPWLFSSPRAGDIVAFRHPEIGLLIKKVEQALPGALFVLGSHPDSVDSRKFGPIPSEAVLGKVIVHVRRRRTTADC